MRISRHPHLNQGARKINFFFFTFAKHSSCAKNSTWWSLSRNFRRWMSRKRSVPSHSGSAQMGVATTRVEAVFGNSRLGIFRNR